MKLQQNEFNSIVARNLIMYRKYNKYTQLALAEKLNYTDKAVSKWESGESLPDVYVLASIAELYGITINDLITPRKKPKPPITISRAIFVPLLSICLAWIVAILSFITLKAFFSTFNLSGLVFILALPVSFILSLIFSCIYKNYVVQLISVSGIIWTTILFVQLCVVNFNKVINLLYLIGIPLQIATILWYTYKFILKRKKI